MRETFYGIMLWNYKNSKSFGEGNSLVDGNKYISRQIMEEMDKIKQS